MKRSCFVGFIPFVVVMALSAESLACEYCWSRWQCRPSYYVPCPPVSQYPQPQTSEGLDVALQQTIENLAAHLAELEVFIENNADISDDLKQELRLRLARIGSPTERRAVARIIARNPDVRLLDEASKNSVRNEVQAIQRALERLKAEVRRLRGGLAGNARQPAHTTATAPTFVSTDAFKPNASIASNSLGEVRHVQTTATQSASVDVSELNQRVWTNKTYTRTFEGEFLRLDANKAYFRADDGRLLATDTSNLCSEDQRLVQRWQATDRLKDSLSQHVGP